MPRYRPRIPPSVLYILIMVCHIPGNFPSCLANAAKPADCIDNRVRTMSRGYVNVTEVMPAKPPQSNRRTGERSAPGAGSANYGLSVWHANDPCRACTYSFVDVVGPELNGRIWDDAYAVRTVPSHEPSPAFVCPHFPQSLPY